MLSKLSELGEAVALAIAVFHSIDARDYVELLKEFERAGCVAEATLARLHTLRRAASHRALSHQESRAEGLKALAAAHALCVWFCQSYYDRSLRVPPFVIHQPDAPLHEAEGFDSLQSSRDLVLRSRSSGEGSAGDQPLSNDPEVRLAQLSELAFGVIEAVKGDPEELRQLLQKIHTSISTARQPLLLGVIGEFRTGKSTLINALAGDEVAFVDEVEATPVPCVFRHGPKRYAQIVRKDGRREDLSIPEANVTLSLHRHDAAWLSSVSHVEYFTPRPGLAGLDIWDSPGLGGSNKNEDVANEFLERVTGALWVFDATIVGKASISGPLRRLKETGKTVVALLNQVDGMDEDEIARAIQYLKTSHPGVFAAIVPVSAKEAVARTLRDEEDARLSELRRVLHECILRNAEKDRLRRIQRTVEASIWLVVDCIESYRRDFSDRLGFLQHTRDNLAAAADRLLESVPQIAAEEAQVAFRATEQAKLSSMGGRFGPLSETFGEAAHRLGVPYQDRSRRGWLLDAVQELDSTESLKQAWQAVSRGVLTRLETEWAAASDQAIELSRSAIPDVAPATLTRTPQAFHPGDEGKIADESVKHGLFVGGIAVAGAGLAAAAGLVAWPALLIALPIGFAAGWKKHSDLSYQAEPSFEEAERRFREHVAHMRKEIAERIGKDLRPKVSALLEQAIFQMAQKHHSEILGPVHERSVLDASKLLQWASQKLQDICSDKERRSGRDLWRKPPVVVTPDPAGNLIFEGLFSSVRVRLDIMLPALDFPLSSILFRLPTSVSVRLITTCHAQDRARLAAEIERGIGTWGGECKIRVLTNQDGSRAQLPGTMLVTPDASLVTNDSMRSFEHSTITLTEHPQGHRAAQREFAEHWEGKSARSGRLRVHPL
jgi:hypothetical protein